MDQQSHSIPDLLSSSSSSPDPSRPVSIAEDDGGEESYIFATIRYDPSLIESSANTKASFNRPSPFFLLEHQWTRLQVASWCTSFYRKPGQSRTPHGSPSAFFHGLNAAVRQWKTTHPNEHHEVLRIKLRSYVSGRITTEIKVVPPQPLSNLFKSTFSTPDQLPKSEWKVVLDVQATEISESTMYKTSDRYPYNRARAHARIWSITLPQEILLYNTDDEILDGSLSTPYFFRGGRWVVPASSSGGLQGITRRWALENGLAVEGVVAKDSLTVGEIVWFSNGSNGFFYGTFVARDESLTPEPTPEEIRYVAMEMAVKK